MSDMVYETEEYKGHTIEIKYDECGMDPRTEWDNLTEIHCLGTSRYYLGEVKHPNREDLTFALNEAKKQGDFVMWVYAYIHSGVALSTRSFYGRLPQGHAEFDSGICGFIVIRRKKYFEEFGGKKWTAKRREHCKTICEQDIATFQAYLNGEVYGYVIDGGSEYDCWGFVGEPDYCMSEAKSSVDFMVNAAKKEHFEKVKTWIRNNVPLGVRYTMAEAIAV